MSGGGGGCGLLGRRWEYRGEGNANIVIALKQEGRVLRFSKVEKGAVAEGELPAFRALVEEEAAFANEVFLPLLGREYGGEVRAVWLEREEVERLNEALRPRRPKDRLHKELGPPVATSHPDFAFIPGSEGPNYCVEVKAKQAVWPAHLRPWGKCTFCLNQFLKLAKGKVSSRTPYCPLDLFSGRPERVVRALFALITNPQNNLRVFKDGVLRYGEHHDPSSLHSLLSEWFTPPGVDQADGDCCDNPKKQRERNLVFLLASALLSGRKGLPAASRADLKTATLSSPTLPVTREECLEGREEGGPPSGSILSRILQIQELSSPLLPSHLYAIYRKLCPLHSRDEEGEEVREKICPSSACLRGPKVFLSGVRCCGGVVGEDELGLLHSYLVGATAKDCSIMVTFSPAPSGLQDLDEGGRSWAVRVGVADLDPKPLSCVVNHYLRDLEMLSQFAAQRGSSPKK